MECLEALEAMNGIVPAVAPATFQIDTNVENVEIQDKVMGVTAMAAGDVVAMVMVEETINVKGVRNGTVLIVALQISWIGSLVGSVDPIKMVVEVPAMVVDTIVVEVVMVIIITGVDMVEMITTGVITMAVDMLSGTLHDKEDGKDGNRERAGHREKKRLRLKKYGIVYLVLHLLS